MTFRKTIFWLHLVAGLVAGIAIGIMCFTGVTLAFEKQLVAWSERDARIVAVPSDKAHRQSLDELTRRVRAAEPDARPTSITIAAEPNTAVAFALGRDRTLYANPYTGEVRSPASTNMHDFMHVMENWHRWLAVSGDQRPIGKAVNGTANIAFFLLAATGLYLWLPRSWSWRSVRGIAFFDVKLAGKARDFNWHNAIGLWCAPVLIVLTLTAMPISYRWANQLVYRLVGEAAPAQAAPGGAPAMENLPLVPAGADAKPLTRDTQFAAVQKEFPAWQQITLRLGGPTPPRPAQNATAAPRAARSGEAIRTNGPTPLSFTVKLPGAWPRTATTTAVLNPFTGDVLRREAFADQTAGRRLRIWTRFLHTGEALGLIGQLVAGLASLGGCVLVYTGVALAWRRFFGQRPRIATPAR